VEAVLAVIVGIVFGSALAAAVASPFRRRQRNRQSGRPERTRRFPLQTADQRHRAGIVAATFALSATVAQFAGWSLIAGYLMLGAVFLAVQAGTSALAARHRRS
jgi:hypothetical protein